MDSPAKLLLIDLPSHNLHNMKPNKSPSKKIRSLRRLVTFLKKKMCMMKPLSSIRNSLSIEMLPAISILPRKQELKLSISKTCLDIPPTILPTQHEPDETPKYSLALKRACASYYKKSLSDLSTDELRKNLKSTASGKKRMASQFTNP